MSEQNEEDVQTEAGEAEERPQVLNEEGRGPESDWTDDSNMPFEDPEKKKRGGCFSLLGFFVIVGITGVLASILVPNYIRARARGQLTACKSNLKNIGTACEMYASDFRGKYPTSLAILTPNYLKSIPDCRGAGEVSYTIQTGNAVYNTVGFEDYYFLRCEGENHAWTGVPANYPQYDGIQGLIER